MLFYGAQILEQALLMFPLVLGIYVSFSVLKIADLSVDGSFVLGGAVFATLITNGVSLFLAIIFSVATGMLAGALCALVQYRNRVDSLIAGILMAFIWHSASLIVMQRPNIGLLSSKNIFSIFHDALDLPLFYSRIAVLVILIGFISCLVGFLLSNTVGLWLKAFGNNQHLVAMLGHNPEKLRLLGLALGNGLAAFSGCLTAQASGYADINMGFGQALIAIAMILLGRELLRLINKNDAIHDGFGILCTFIGVAFYFFLTNQLIRYGLSPVYLKMAVGILLIFFLLLAAHRAIKSRRSA